MSKLIRALLSGFFLSISALLYLGFHLRISLHEYYFVTYLAQGVVFFAAAFASGSLATAVLPKRLPGCAAFLIFCLTSLFAWGASAVFLLMLNLTPLCVGQNNGDGNNNLGICIFQSVLASLVYTVPVMFFSGLTSLAAAGLRPR